MIQAPPPVARRSGHSELSEVSDAPGRAPDTLAVEDAARGRAPAPPPARVTRRIVDRLTSPMAKGSGLAVAAGVAAGVGTPLVSLSSRRVGAFAAAGMMQAGGSVFSWGMALVISQQGIPLFPLDGKAAALVLGSTLTGSVVAPGLLALALKHTSAASVALTMNVEPFLAAAAAWPLFHERPSAHMGAAAAAAVASMVLCTVGELRQEPASGLGIGLTVVCAASWATWSQFFNLLRDRKPQQLVGICSALGALACGSLGGVLGEPFPHGRDAAKLLGCGILAFAAVDTLITLSMRHIGVGRSSLIFSTMGLAVGTTASCAMGQGHFSALIGASLGVALLGAAVLAMENYRQPVAVPAEVDLEAQGSAGQPGAMEVQLRVGTGDVVAVSVRDDAS